MRIYDIYENILEYIFLEKNSSFVDWWIEDSKVKNYVSQNANQLFITKFQWL